MYLYLHIFKILLCLINAHPLSMSGKGEEQRAAASLACLLCIQLGSGIRERGGAENPETSLQKHPGRRISQHTSPTGCEYMAYIVMMSADTFEKCMLDRDAVKKTSSASLSLLK